MLVSRWKSKIYKQAVASECVLSVMARLDGYRAQYSFGDTFLFVFRMA